MLVYLGFKITYFGLFAVVYYILILDFVFADEIIAAALGFQQGNNLEHIIQY